MHELIGQRSRHDVVKKSIARPANDLHALRAGEVSSGGIDIEDARKHPEIGSAPFLGCACGVHGLRDKPAVRARYIQHLIEDGQAEPAITADDSLRVDSGERYDVILTNPPCGEKSSFGMVNEEGD